MQSNFVYIYILSMFYIASTEKNTLIASEFWLYGTSKIVSPFSFSHRKYTLPFRWPFKIFTHLPFINKPLADWFKISFANHAAQNSFDVRQYLSQLTGEHLRTISFNKYPYVYIYQYIFLRTIGTQARTHLFFFIYCANTLLDYTFELYFVYIFL